MIKVQIELDEYETRKEPLLPNSIERRVEKDYNILDIITDISNKPEYSTMKVYSHEIREESIPIGEPKKFILDNKYCWTEFLPEEHKTEDRYKHIQIHQQYKIKKVLNIYFQ